MTALTARVSHEHVFTGFAILAAVFCIGAGVVIGRYQGAVTITHTRVVHVQQSFGTPDQTIPASQINPQLPAAGVNRCDVYTAKKTLVCHP